MQLLAAKSSKQLLLWALLLLPAAWFADCVLDAVLFGDETVWEQLTHPGYQEIAIRVLFSIFILAAVFLGTHFLNKSARREVLLLQQAQSLEQLKRELDEFNSSSAKHLRDTAAQISTSTALLKEYCQQQLDEKALFLVDNVLSASDQMCDRVQTILQLTETATTEVRREQIDLGQLARKVADKFSKAHPERSIEFRIADDIPAWCDPNLMHEILTRLFKAAALLIPPERTGTIEFGKLYRNSQATYFVRDNGVGYNDAQAERLFNPFRDPRQDPELPEDPLLLATARRLVVRHGGRIWAEGVPGGGGSIFFTDYAPEASGSAGSS